MGVGNFFLHPSRWPCVKVTKLPKRHTIYLIPMIKWELLIQSLQKLVQLMGKKRKWVNWMLCWLEYLWPWPLTLNLCMLGMGGPIVIEQKGWELIGCPDVKHYGNESSGCCTDWGTFDLEFSRSNCISRMGGSIVMQRRGRESLVCPDVKH